MQIERLQFEEFKAPSGRTTPFVTMNKNGRIYLSTATASIYEIDEKKFPAVKLYYDPRQKVVALKPLTQLEEGALPLKYPKYGGAFINGISFATKYNLTAGGKLLTLLVGKYPVEKKRVAGLGNVLLFDLRAKHK